MLNVNRPIVDQNLLKKMHHQCNASVDSKAFLFPISVQTDTDPILSDHTRTHLKGWQLFVKVIIPLFRQLGVYCAASKELQYGNMCTYAYMIDQNFCTFSQH